MFPRASYRRWYGLGGWNEDHVAFSIADGADIVASASLQRMEIVLRGEWITGWQLGAAGVKRVIESVFAAEYDVKPASEPLRALSIDRAEDLALFARVAATAAPTMREFGARDYYPGAQVRGQRLISSPRGGPA